MKMILWNCRGLGGPSTVSQLKDSIRIHHPNFMFLSELKKQKDFVKTICVKLGYKDRLVAVDPIGISGGLVLLWDSSQNIIQIIQHSFCFEVEIGKPNSNVSFWVVFVYMSTDRVIREDQWSFLINAKSKWGQDWIIGGDWNAIVDLSEKRGGRDKSLADMLSFQNFINQMSMVEVNMQGHKYTWSNNRSHEHFVEEKLDRVFGSLRWSSSHSSTVVLNCYQTASDHSLLVLISELTQIKPKARFIFNKQWIEKQDVMDVVKKAWEPLLFCSILWVVGNELLDLESFSKEDGSKLRSPLNCPNHTK
ncbi:non-LTR reverse transcriptase [Striga asiatica]|uniref:Non-LTR reverse transcriptase n=1 Tax=Striga asiatica TaxID=4170 RepID=A0A5A7R7F1_STRAF|nr:non-LTR reverse transcriptase [Striga asiatica]